MWFESIVSFEKDADNGKRKKVKEKYLVDAMSCTEAEARMIQEVSPFMNEASNLNVDSTKKVEYSDVVLSEKDFFYEARLELITLDEGNGVERRTKHKSLIQANSFDEAKETLDRYVKGFMADIEICGLAKTALVDVYPYKAPEGCTQN